MNKKELYLAIRTRLEEGGFNLTEVLENDTAFYAGQILPVTETTDNFTLYAPRAINVSLTVDCFIEIYMIIAKPMYNENEDTIYAVENKFTLYTGYVKSLEFLGSILDATGVERAVKTKDKYFYRNICVAQDGNRSELFNPISWTEYVIIYENQRREFVNGCIRTYMERADFKEEIIESMIIFNRNVSDFTLQAILYGLAETFGEEEDPELKFTIEDVRNNWL